MIRRPLRQRARQPPSMHDASPPSTAIAPPCETGVVAIGRNEGERLRRCLASVRRAGLPCVYVDSGSTDDSVAIAQSAGATVLHLDMAQPFTAARARNAGWRALRQQVPGLRFVQFVDGDCELREGWLQGALDFLDTHPQVAVVAGRRRERAPEASRYNQFCDIEWDTPVGEARAVGGDAMFRVQPLVAAGGYRDSLIAGEEPELCVRLRARGWKVWRLPLEMTWHDAGMSRWSQWWRRNVRSGHAFAEGAALHGQPPERHFVAETRRAVLWGAGLPLLTLAGALLHPALLLLALAYPLQMLRLGARLARTACPLPWQHGAFLVLGRFPEARGVATYVWGRLRRHGSKIIEYK